MIFSYHLLNDLNETDLVAGLSWNIVSAYPSETTAGIFVNDYVYPSVIQLIDPDRGSSS